MYGGYNTTGSPPLPDIIGPYYTTGYGSGGIAGLGVGGGLAPPSSAYLPDMYYPSYMYADGAATAAGLYGSTSPIRRRRYSIAGLPSATMMNDYYNLYPTSSAAGFGVQAPLQHASSSNIVNLLNETHKSISRSSQILNQHARLQQATQPITTLTGGMHYPGRVISSYPTLHPGGEISPPYLNDNLLQMSTSFSSQPNMYFQPYTTPVTPAARSLLRPAYSVSNLSANMPNYTSRYTTGGVGTSNYPYTQSLLNHSDLPYILQQRQLLSSLHASNPAISQYYQQQLPHYLQHYAQQPSASSMAYNLQQQFAGTQQQQQQQQQAHYGHQLATQMHPSAHIHHSVAQQLNPNHQYHVHSQQNHLQTHPLATLINTGSPFAGQLASSALNVDNLHTTNAYQQQQAAAAAPPPPPPSQAPPTHHHHHPHVHHPTAPHTHHPLPTHYHHHHTPYSKLDLEYPKLPQEHKRQVSFKFDVDQLSLDS